MDDVEWAGRGRGEEGLWSYRSDTTVFDISYAGERLKKL